MNGLDMLFENRYIVLLVATFRTDVRLLVTVALILVFSQTSLVVASECTLIAPTTIPHINKHTYLYYIFFVKFLFIKNKKKIVTRVSDLSE